MKVIKIIIPILIVLIIVLLSIRFFLVKLDEGEETILVIEDTLELEKDTNVYFSLTYHINNYLTYVSNKETKQILSILELDYRTKEKVTEENILKKIRTYNNEPIFYAREVYYRETEEQIVTYYVYGLIEYNNNREDGYFAVRIDYNNSTYSISYIDNFNNLKVGEKITANTTEIKRNEYNIYEYSYIADYEKAAMIFEDYKSDLRQDSELAFEKLDPECKSKNFLNNIEIFKQYITENKEQIYNSTVSSYKIDESENGYTIFYIEDSYESYYTIKIGTGFEYTVKLEEDKNF